MLTRLNYLRNPRFFDPPNLNPESLAFLEACKPPGIPHKTTRSGAIFVLDPPEVLFNDYQIANVYSATINIRNVTSVVRLLRVTPPKSQYFHASLLRYPTHSGRIAPGMAAQLTIRFTPDSLADYDDFVIVETPGAPVLKLPLLARRDPPVLTLQEVRIWRVLMYAGLRDGAGMNDVLPACFH